MNTASRLLTTRYLPAITMGIALAVLLIIALPQLWYPLWFDQGAFAACADVLRHGGAMYRDCWEERGPAIVLAYAIPMLFSTSPLAIHGFDLLWQAMTAVLLGMFAVKLFGRRAGIVAGALYWLMIAGVNYWATAQAESFANLFFVAALFTAWLGMQQTTPVPAHAERQPQDLSTMSSGGRATHARLWLVISGACIGILFWFKYPFILLAAVPLLLIALSSRRSGSYLARFARLRLMLVFAAGGLGVLSIGLAGFAVSGALGDLNTQVAYDISTFNNVPLDARLEWVRKDFAPEAAAFVSFGNTPTADYKDTVTQISILGRGYPYLFLLLAVGLLAGLWRPRTRKAALYALGYFTVAIAICVWQGHFYRYHFLIVLPVMALLAGAGVSETANQRRSSRPDATSVLSGVTLLLLVGAVAGLVASMLPWVRDAFDNAILQRKSPQAIYLESKLAPVVTMAQALQKQTSVDDRIVIFSDVPAIYPLSGRLNGTRFPYLRWVQESGSAAVRALYAQEFLDDLTRSRPKFFVLTQPDFPWPGADFIGLWKSMPPIQQYVEAHYHYVGENGPFLLFLRNE